MSIGKVCNRETVIVRKHASITETARLMREEHVGSVVVVDDADGIVRPVGIVTDRDVVLEVVAPGIDPLSLTAGDLIGEELFTAVEHDGVWDTIQRLRAKGVRRMPVVNSGGQLVGIVTVDDLLEVLAVELGELAKVIGREQLREQRVRPPV